MSTKNVKLDKPGAGLPLPELLVAKVMFRRLVKKDREVATAKFREERGIISELIAHPTENFIEPVLVKRLRGMEDSSRFWSVWMVIDHLRIVNRNIAFTIASLGKGKVSSRKISTADVKPAPDTGPEVLPDYEKSCEQVLQSADAIAELHTKEMYSHPWFGPMNAQEWYFLAAMHMGIHRKQIEEILRNL